MSSKRQHIEEARKVYNLFWDSYQSGDIDSFALTLDEKFEMIGKAPIEVDINLQLDEKVGDAPLIAEDFSRVILNLCNNAFDACAEQSRNASNHNAGKDLQGFQNLGGLEDYQPKLTVRTFRKENTVTIELEDNGPGIPGEIKDKILQPFFTTKKGTQGTGLGLSITNDIVKAHGGSLEIESTPGVGSTFCIHLEKRVKNGF